MAENSTPEEKTEEPTGRRITELRKEGAIHCSVELAHLLSLLAGYLMLRMVAVGLHRDLLEVFRRAFQRIEDTEPLTIPEMNNGLIKLLMLVSPRILALTLVVAAVGSLAVLLQTKFNVKEKKIQFRFDLLNPVTGIKRVFSMHGVVNTLKAILKLAIICPMAYFGLHGLIPKLTMAAHLKIPELMGLVGQAMNTLFWKVFAVLLIFAAFDFAYGKWQWLRQNRMTKDEVKDEHKAVEGDEATRRAIQRKGLERIVKRLKSSVKQADVVITNPTHYAVALKYVKGEMNAPTVVAKGRGFLALRIREMAKEAGIPVMERRWLARTLYASVKEGAEIPRELFRAVAEVLAYVYRIKSKRPTQTASQAGNGR